MRLGVIYGCLLLGIGLLMAIPRPIPVIAAPKPARVETHTEWIAKSLTKMQTVRVGMTRADVLKVFTTEGGLYTSTARTYVYRECPYIKVDITFSHVTRSQRAKDGHRIQVKSPLDKIQTISKPYLEWTVGD